MSVFENLLTEAEKKDIKIIEKYFKSNAKGLYKDNIIGISRSISLESEKACVLAEELGHYYTSYGNILDHNDIRNMKQEKRAMNWAYEKLVPLDKLVAAYEAGVRNRNEMAEYLEVIEDFLEGAINHYSEIYGLYKEHSGYLIYFDPLGIFKSFE